MNISDKVPLQALEYLQAELDLLRREVDCISQAMRPLKALQDTMDMILRNTSDNN